MTPVGLRGRPGFTLIELLVVIAIIAVLMGLLFPAVQSVRESGRRAQCLNNMRQLAVAAQAYAQSMGRLPASTGSDNRDGSAAYQAKVTRRNWIVPLLPFLDQAALYGQIDITTPMNQGNNLKLAQLDLPVAVCPSDTSAAKLAITEISQKNIWCPTCGGNTETVYDDDVPYTVTGSPVARTSYAANSGDHYNQAGVSIGYPPYYANDTYDLSQLRGVISRCGAAAAFSDINDGASNTFLFGEIVGGWCFWQSWALQSWATTAHPINFENYRGTRMTADADTCIGFRSLHPGGAVFAFCDNSIRFVSESIDGVTYRARASRSGREIVADDRSY